MSTYRLRVELQQLEKKRTEFRCRLADEELSPEQKERRKARRLIEAELGVLIPPGVWDEDLDLYPGPEYTENLGDGYTATVRRSKERSWNCYITLPEGHPAISEHYDLFNGHITSSIPRCPLELTYVNGATFGIDHRHLRDTRPTLQAEYTRETYYSGASTERNPYVTHAMALEECRQLKAYFEEIKGMADPSPRAIESAPPDIHTGNPSVIVEEPPSPKYMTAEEIDAPPKSWASIVRGAKKKLIQTESQFNVTEKNVSDL
jgi:hypothetical protein